MSKSKSQDLNKAKLYLLKLPKLLKKLNESVPISIIEITARFFKALGHSVEARHYVRLLPIAIRDPHSVTAMIQDALGEISQKYPGDWTKIPKDDQRWPQYRDLGNF